MERCILHADLNNFYASVECLYRPEIRDKYVVVGGDVEARHGIVLAKNNKAKACGIKTGEALWQARQKCPQLVSVPPNYALYLRFSKLFRNILYDYSPMVESFGLDECWIDVTATIHKHSKYSSGEQIAEEIRQRTKDELGITASIGVSWNKIFAKLGSDMKKPDATTVITPENYKEKVWPLPVGDLLYVGRATERKLNRIAVTTIGQLATLQENVARSIFGKVGLVLIAFANGADSSRVENIGFEQAVKGVGNSMTTPRDLVNFEDVSLVFYILAESVSMRLKEQGLVGNVIGISLRDNQLFSFVRQRKISRPTSLASEIHDEALALAKANFQFERPLRSVGIRVTNLSQENAQQQLSLFEDEERRKKLDTLERYVMDIRNRYGNLSVRRAVLLKDSMGLTDAKADHIIHPISFFKGAIES